MPAPRPGLRRRLVGDPRPRPWLPPDAPVYLAAAGACGAALAGVLYALSRLSLLFS